MAVLQDGSVTAVSTSELLREWGRIGVLGFGGPPAHISMLRELCVEDREWIDARHFEDANAACGLLPGPASTQMAILMAHHVAGLRGALVGGLAFILPGLAIILVLSALYLGGTPPEWVRGLAAGAGAAVIAVVAQAGVSFGRAALEGRVGAERTRAIAYALFAGGVTVITGAWVVLALLACGFAELAIRRRGWSDRAVSVALPALVVAATGVAALPALAWTAFKVGALSYGGGFVIIPLMQADAVRHGWMTDAEFGGALALGQITPGPVTHTIAVVGYSAAGIGGALLASLIAFAPSFLVVLMGGERFERVRANANARAFLDGAGPAAVGAILGASVLLLDGITETWQLAVVVVAALALFVARLGTVPVLLAAGAAGAVVALAGGSVPG
ncbi:MAG: chromate efflux transporter [Solirubrobacteraceae bacterium]|nr:chromate efflux transporter [Solirubrobacteraceae bacterium]